MSHIFFISDVHLAMRPDAAEKRRTETLLAFLEHVRAEAAELFVLGDLFDFWFEWRHVVPRYYFPVLHALHGLVRAGVEVHFLAGNHDFSAGPYLQEAVGLHWHPADLDLERDGRRFFLSHGDGLARADRGYRLLKRVIRHPAAIFLFRHLLHPDWGMALARLTSDSSRRLRTIDRPAWADEYAERAEQKLQAGWDYVVLGHIHYPQRLVFGDKVYINLGDWIGEYTYARFDGRELTLERWPAGVSPCPADIRNPRG